MKSLIVLMAFVTLYVVEARAAECPASPPGVAPGCKIVTINPAEEQSMLGQNNILDAASWARRMELDQVTAYWREKIRNAPAGEIPRPPTADKPPATTPPPAAKQ